MRVKIAVLMLFMICFIYAEPTPPAGKTLLKWRFGVLQEQIEWFIIQMLVIDSWMGLFIGWDLTGPGLGGLSQFGFITQGFKIP